MHEYSIVADLIEKCEDYERTYQAKIITIVVGIGERSGVNAELLLHAFENYTENGNLSAAKLEIQPIPITIACMECNARFSPKALEYGVCQDCKSHNVRIIEGEEMVLLRLEMDKEE